MLTSVKEKILAVALLVVLLGGGFLYWNSTRTAYGPWLESSRLTLQTDYDKIKYSADVAGCQIKATKRTETLYKYIKVRCPIGTDPAGVLNQ